MFFAAGKTISAGSSQVCLQRYATSGNSPYLLHSERRGRIATAPRQYFCQDHGVRSVYISASPSLLALFDCLFKSLSDPGFIFVVRLHGPGREMGVDEVMHGVLQHVELFLACWKVVELLPPDLTECQSEHGFLIWSHHSSDPGLFFSQCRVPYRTSVGRELRCDQPCRRTRTPGSPCR